MRDSERYERQAQAVLRMAAKAGGDAQRQVYLRIADGWSKLAAEAADHERGSRPPEDRSFLQSDD